MNRTIYLELDKYDAGLVQAGLGVAVQSGNPELKRDYKRVISEIKKLQSEKSLFIALKSEYYEAFDRGEKTIEYRKYGPRWNEKTCRIGRLVTISKGYGRQTRRTGIVVGFEKSKDATKRKDWIDCYGHGEALAACIHIELDPPAHV